MRLLEQFLSNKKRKYYHGSPILIDHIVGNDYNGLSIAFLTTDIYYAAKFAKDLWSNKEAGPGYIYQVEFTKIPDVFNANSPRDMARRRSEISVDDKWLFGIQNFDWLFLSEKAFGKNRSLVLKDL